MSIVIGRKCHLLEFSARGSAFSTWAGRTCVLQCGFAGPDFSPHVRVRPAALACLLVFLAAATGSPIVRAQLPPLQAPSSWGQVPQGSGACSVGKTCSDLAPGMIRDALGPSPIDQEVQTLTRLLSSDGDSATIQHRAADWAATAFRRAGADQVRIETAAGAQNVIAEIRGRSFPRDYILVAELLNSRSDGAVAAARNAVMLIDAVRVIHDTGNLPRRSIRFVLFGTAGPTSRGRLTDAWAYVSQHHSDLDRVAAALAMSADAGYLDGFSLENRPDVLASVRQALDPLRSFGIRHFSQEMVIPTAVTPFWLEGIPSLVGISGAATGSHATAAPAASPTMTTGTAELKALKRGVAVASVAAYGLADAEYRIGPRRSRREVEESIKAMHLRPTLEAAGLWEEWKAFPTARAH
jgi:hypothetical protein